jgi:iron complex transport system substrate-binding protein
MLALTRLLFIISSIACGTSVNAREIVDMAGRHVTISDKVTKVFVSSYPLTMLFYAFAPDLLIATNFPLAEPAKEFVPHEVAALPAIGGTPGQGRTLNPEEVMALKPELILAWVDPFGDNDHTEKQFAATGLPIVFVSMNRLADYPAALRFLGILFERETRATQLATYIENAIDNVQRAVANLPEDKKLKVYYAESRDGLATECDTSFHIEPIVIAGAKNVHHCPQTTHFGMEKVSLEQIIQDKPDMILAQEPRFAEAVAANPVWRNVEAVSNGRVVTIPRLPFNWIDRPPSFMRALGIQWLANLFYPDLFPIDLKAETKRFYSLFLGVELSEGDVARILR